MLKIYNTLTRTKQEFKNHEVKMYLCGPTVYKPTHLGHMLGPTIFSTIKKYLTFLGHNVKWAINITNIDDKIIETAKEMNLSTRELTQQMTDDYYHSLAHLNIDNIDMMPTATYYIPDIIKMIAELIGKEFAYPVNGDVYFNTEKYEKYGVLSTQMLSENSIKKKPGDFALWKASKPTDPKEFRYDSPFGCGRPGWHIECSCMVKALFGETIDIHGGGIDLLFPHHENEMTQSECLHQKPFSRFWMHHGLIKVKDQKMSGSLNNFLKINELAKKFSGDDIRMLLLSSHYRSHYDLGEIQDGIPTSLTAAHNSMQTLNQTFSRIEKSKTFSELQFIEPKLAFADLFHRFKEFMDDDFNTAGALSVIFELSKILNKLADSLKLNTASSHNPKEFLEGASLFKFMTDIFGFAFKPFKPKADLTTELINIIVESRKTLKNQAKMTPENNPVRGIMWQQADWLRTKLRELGIILEDNDQETKWRMQ